MISEAQQILFRAYRESWNQPDPSEHKMRSHVKQLQPFLFGEKGRTITQ